MVAIFRAAAITECEKCEGMCRVSAAELFFQEIEGMIYGVDLEDWPLLEQIQAAVHDTFHRVHCHDNDCLPWVWVRYQWRKVIFRSAKPPRF